MDLELKEKKYKVIKNFIPPDFAKKLAKEFEDYCDKNNVGEDSQVKNSRAQYNYISFLELLTEKTPEISKIIGEKVLPTYAYSRVYKNKNLLESHKDRGSCEVSITLHLNGDLPWGIYFEEKEKTYINLGPGDAIVYLGEHIAHGRDEYMGDTYTQVFLHYVLSRGKNSHLYFDNKKFSSATLAESDYIKVYDNIIDLQLCDSIVSQYDEDEWYPSELGHEGIVNKKIRNCSSVDISIQKTIDRNKKDRKQIDEKIFKTVSKAISKYAEDFPELNISSDSGYILLKYDTGGFYVQHTDSYTQNPRTVACSLILNDDYEGGEFGFFDRKIKIKPKKGSVVMFPSNFMFPHEIMPVTKGTRYSIITWFS